MNRLVCFICYLYPEACRLYLAEEPKWLYGYCCTIFDLLFGAALCLCGVSYADAQTSGYIDVCEVAPGRLLVVYDVHNTPSSKIWLWEPKEHNGVYGMYVDVLYKK